MKGNTSTMNRDHTITTKREKDEDFKSNERPAELEDEIVDDSSNT